MSLCKHSAPIFATLLWLGCTVVSAQSNDDIWLSIPKDSDQLPFISGIAKSDENGRVQFQLLRRVDSRDETLKWTGLTKATYFAFRCEPSPDGGLNYDTSVLFKVQVTEVGRDQGFQGVVDKSMLGRFKDRQLVAIFRPFGMPDQDVDRIPDVLEIGALKKKGNAAQDAVRSRSNLSNIGLALHNFHDAWGRFPPAVIYGPDGKPWHSWRVLILPFIDEVALYNAYDFNEPWNGPKNSKLLQHIPEVYRDPVHGETNDTLSHYTAITGPGTAFSPKGEKMVRGERPQMVGPNCVSLKMIRDSRNQTVIVGTIGPSNGIPWMKPEDTPWTRNQTPNPFGFHHRIGDDVLGFFLFSDASVKGIRKQVSPGTFHSLATIAGAEVIDLNGPDFIDLREIQIPEPKIRVRFINGRAEAEIVPHKGAPQTRFVPVP